MSDHIAEDGSFINSIVGEGTRFKGELDLNGLLRIDGDYSGIIRTPGKVLVGKNGRAECSIFAGTVVVGGAVKGDIHAAEKVIVLSTGMIIGNILTPRLIVEEGVILHGECTIRADETVPAKKRPEDGAKVQDTPVPPAEPIVSGSSAEPDTEPPVHPPDTDMVQEETEEVSVWNG